MQTVECILVKTLLILGAGPDQIPGIIKAREMGLYTIALDGNANAQGRAFADEFYKVSIKHYQQVESFIENTLSKKIDGVIAFGVDIPYIISRTATKLNVNYTICNEVAQLSEDKYQSKCFMQEVEVNIPAFKLVSKKNEVIAFINQHHFPIIVKPIDNSAARGVSFINSFTQIDRAFDEALNNSNSNKILIEKYLNGPQVSTESFVINGKIHNIGFADRNYSNMQRFFPSIIEDGGDLPSLHMSPQLKGALSEQLQRIVDGLSIKNAVIKGDIVIHQDKLFIIEFALRLSGGNFSTIEIPESTGVDFLKVAIKLHLNEAIQPSELTISKHKFISIRYKFAEDQQQGKIKSLTLPEKKENIIQQAFHVNTNDILESHTTNHANRLGFVISQGKSREHAIQCALQQLKKMSISID